MLDFITFVYSKSSRKSMANILPVPAGAALHRG